MALYYASGSGRRDSGKFHSRRRLGMQHGGQQEYDGYRLELLSMETNGPIQRTKFHVRIFNERNVRVECLRDFSSAAQAINAAQEWVNERRLTVRRGL